MPTVRAAYAPLVFVAFLAAGLAVGSPLLLAPLLVMAILVSFGAEQLAPYEVDWNRPHGDLGRDLAHAVVNELSNAGAALLLPLLASVAPHAGLWPVAWPRWAQLGLAVLVADGGITLAHYASHRSAGLWRLHAVHHSVRRLYGFNGLMKHPLHQAIELTAGTTPLLLLGMPQDIAWLLAYAVAIQLLLQHSNVDMRLGPLVYIWAVAPAHRFHHVASARDGDVNFGLFTAVWDHLLGTFAVRSAAPRAGELGIAGRPRYPQTYLAQLRAPFAPQSTPGWHVRHPSSLLRGQGRHLRRNVFLGSALFVAIAIAEILASGSCDQRPIPGRTLGSGSGT